MAQQNTAGQEPCSCLCGAVTYAVRLKGDTVSACHCGMCQKWAGGISLAIECEPDVAFDDMAHVGVYVSSDWGERLFCTKCGSPVLWRTRDGSMANLPPSALDRAADLALRTEFCIDRKPDYYGLAGDRTRMTEAEMIALYTEASPGSA